MIVTILHHTSLKLGLKLLHTLTVLTHKRLFLLMYLYHRLEEATRLNVERVQTEAAIYWIIMGRLIPWNR